MVTLSRPGQNLGAGDENAKFLTKWSGEVLAAFKNKNQFLELTRSKDLQGAKSHVFPVVGIATTSWHTPGDSLIRDGSYLNNIKSTEKEVFADNVLVAPTMVYDLDEMKSHWEARREYTDALSHALAQQADEHILATILAAARSAENITGQTGSTTAIDIATLTGAELAAAALEAAQQFDTLNVPEEDRIFVVRPQGYYLLLDEKDLLDSDYNEGNGDFAKAKIWYVAGMRIVKTNNMPVTNLAGTPDVGAKNDPFGTGDGYNGDWRYVHALAFHRSCVGTVRMKSLSLEGQSMLQYMGTFFLASYVMGHGVLRPEAAVEIGTYP